MWSERALFRCHEKWLFVVHYSSLHDAVVHRPGVTDATMTPRTFELLARKTATLTAFDLFGKQLRQVRPL